jgi:hypothetical protein
MFFGLAGCTLSSNESNSTGTPSVTSASLSSGQLTVGGGNLSSVASLSLLQNGISVPFSVLTRGAAQLSGFAFQGGSIAAAQPLSLLTMDTQAQAQSSTTLTINLTGLPLSNFTSTGITDSATGTVLTIAASGNVGIGTTSPSSTLHILNSSDSTQLTIGNPTSGHTYGTISTSADTGGYFNIQGIANAGSSFGNMALQGAGGNVGIGTTSPANPLQVSSSTTNVGASFSNPGLTSSYIQFNTSEAIPMRVGVDTNFLSFESGAGASYMAISGSGANTGYVGIGTTSPAGILDVEGGTSTTGSATNIKLAAQNAKASGNTSGGNIILIPGTAHGSGSPGVVGIGTTNPSLNAALEIDTLANGATAQAIQLGNNGSNFIVFYGGGGYTSQAGSIAVTNAGVPAVTYNTTSDRRTKENIAETQFSLDDLMKIKVRDFNFIKDPKHTRVTGFIAQELNQVFPDAVHTNGDDGTGPIALKAGPWGIDYGRLTPLLVKSLQDLKSAQDQQVKSQQSEIARLKSENAELKSAICEINPSSKICF